MIDNLHCSKLCMHVATKILLSNELDSILLDQEQLFHLFAVCYFVVAKDSFCFLALKEPVLIQTKVADNKLIIIAIA